MSRRERVIAGCLAGLSVALMCVGFVSGTPLRHLLQIIPAVVVFTLVTRRFPWATWAALPVFAFWLLIMIAIWLFMLGLARIITGHFSPAEVALTVVIGLCSTVGAAAVVSSRPQGGRLRSLAALALVAALQVAAMWLSLQPFAAER